MDVAGLFSVLTENPTLLMALLALSGLSLAGVAAAGVAQGRKDVRRRVAGAPGSGSGAAAKAARGPDNRSLEHLMRYVETTFANYDQRHMAVLRLQLVQAGFFDTRAPAVFFASRFASAIVCGLVSLAVLPLVLSENSNFVVMVAGAAALGYFAPSFYLRQRISTRTAQHRAGFPDFMDLMVVCAEAGLSLEASIDRVARELVDAYPALAENLYMVSLEMRAGKAFGDALNRLGQRLGIEEAVSLASLLQQSSELGTSLVTSLKIYSDEMRNKRMSRAEEKAYALPAKLVVPLMLFVFPVLIATLMTPVIITFADGLGN